MRTKKNILKEISDSMHKMKNNKITRENFTAEMLVVYAELLIDIRDTLKNETKVYNVDVRN